MQRCRGEIERDSFERDMAYSAWTDALISGGASDAVVAVVADPPEERGDRLAVP